ncbi:MAG: 50S ribosomal protein L16 [Candidatus Methanomethylicia archaeon]
MPLRPGRCYRRIDTPPYTRKEYIPGVPACKIAKFEDGDPNGEYDYALYIRTLENGQIRHNALESARVMITKSLSNRISGSFYFKLLVYPHQVIRENKMMAFAGADRIQDGMRQAFGKPIGLAARVKAGQNIVVVKVKKPYIEAAKEALKRGKSKIPIPSQIVMEPLEPKTVSQTQ